MSCVGSKPTASSDVAWFQGDDWYCTQTNETQSLPLRFSSGPAKTSDEGHICMCVYIYNIHIQRNPSRNSSQPEAWRVWSASGPATNQTATALG